MMSLRAVLLLAALLAPATGARAADSAPPESLFVAGNTAYEAGDYAGAIDHYARVHDAGVVHADLYYNLGNAWFKAGDLGRAVLWYERARRLEPRDGDVRENLSVARSLVRDRELLPKEGGVRGALLAWHRALSASESATVAFVLSWLLCLAAVCLVFRRTEFVRRLYAPASWFSPARLFGLTMAQDFVLAISILALLTGLFAASAGTKTRAEGRHLAGVVVAEEVSVFSGPSRESTVQFKIHEGTIVSVRDARSGWVRVDLPGDLSGWVDAGSVERI